MLQTMRRGRFAEANNETHVPRKSAKGTSWPAARMRKGPRKLEYCPSRFVGNKNQRSNGRVCPLILAQCPVALLFFGGGRLSSQNQPTTKGCASDDNWESHSRSSICSTPDFSILFSTSHSRGSLALFCSFRLVFIASV